MKLGRNTLLKKKANKTARMALASKEKSEKIRLSGEVKQFTRAEIDSFKIGYEFKPKNCSYSNTTKPFIPYKEFSKKKNKEIVKAQKAKGIPLTYAEAANSWVGKRAARKRLKAALRDNKTALVDSEPIAPMPSKKAGHLGKKSERYELSKQVLAKFKIFGRTK